jgi:predicted RNA-binding Zn-ribbon protein involved in translation (DUF1610 family)
MTLYATCPLCHAPSSAQEWNEKTRQRYTNIYPMAEDIKPARFACPKCGEESSDRNITKHNLSGNTNQDFSKLLSNKQGVKTND